MKIQTLKSVQVSCTCSHWLLTIARQLITAKTTNNLHLFIFLKFGVFSSYIHIYISVEQFINTVILITMKVIFFFNMKMYYKCLNWLLQLTFKLLKQTFGCFKKRNGGEFFIQNIYFSLKLKIKSSHIKGIFSGM